MDHMEAPMTIERGEGEEMTTPEPVAGEII